MRMTGKPLAPQDPQHENVGEGVSSAPQPSGAAPLPPPAKTVADLPKGPHPDGDSGSFDLDWTSAGNDYDFALSWRARAWVMCGLITEAAEKYAATGDQEWRQVLEQYWGWFRGAPGNAAHREEYCVIFSLGVIGPLAAIGNGRFAGTMDLPDRGELIRLLDRGNDGDRLRLADVGDVRSLVRPLAEDSHAEFLRLARWVRWLYGFLHGCDPRRLPLELTAAVLLHWRHSGGRRRVMWLEKSEGDDADLSKLLCNKYGSIAVLLAEMDLSPCPKSPTKTYRVGTVSTTRVPKEILSFKERRRKPWSLILAGIPAAVGGAATGR